MYFPIWNYLSYPVLCWHFFRHLSNDPTGKVTQAVFAHSSFLERVSVLLGTWHSARLKALKFPISAFAKWPSMQTCVLCYLLQFSPFYIDADYEEGCKTCVGFTWYRKVAHLGVSVWGPTGREVVSAGRLLPDMRLLELLGYDAASSRPQSVRVHPIVVTHGRANKYLLSLHNDSVHSLLSEGNDRLPLCVLVPMHTLLTSFDTANKH